MGLNKNAKSFKSDKRLEREYYRREMRNESNYLEFGMLPSRPSGNHLWPVHEHSRNIGVLLPDVCMFCWETVYPESAYEGTAWMHMTTASPRCYRKYTQTAVPIPGVLVIEELDL